MKACIFEFCEIPHGYLNVTLIPKVGEPTEQLLPFDAELFKNASVDELRDMARGIAAALGREKLPPITLLIRSERIYKTALRLPVANKRYATKLYKKEKKRIAVEGYATKADVCKGAKGYIFNTYYLPLNIISSFKIIAKQLSSRIASAMPYGLHLNAQLHTSGEYVHFDIKQNACSMIYQRNGELISAYDFGFEVVEDIKKRYLLVVSKHEFYNENIRQTCYGLTSDKDIALEFGLRQADPDEWNKKEEEQ